MRRRDIERAIVALLRERGERTACPSEVARRIAPEDWRAWMSEVRAVASQLQARGVVEGRQRGAAIDIATAKGPIRLALVR